MPSIETAGSYAEAQPRLNAAERASSRAVGLTAHELIALGVPVLLLAVLSFNNLGATSLWRDEFASIEFSSASIGSLLTIIGRDRSEVGLANMATYYLILHFWLALGDSEVAIRSLSAILGAATVIPVYFVGRKVAGRPAGAVSALVFATSSYAIVWNQQARGYSLAMLLTATLTWLLLLGVERRQMRYWLLYGFVAAAGLYVHFFIGLVVAAHGLWVVASRSFPPWRQAAAAVVPFVIAAIPIPFVVFRYGGGHKWIDAATVQQVVRTFSAVAGGLPLLIALSALTLLAMYSYRRNAKAWLVVGTLLLPIVAAIIVSMFKPTLVSRYFVISLPPLAVVAGIALWSLKPMLLRAGVIAGLAVLLALALPSAYRDTRQQDWRGAGQWIAGETRPGDAIAVVSWGRRPIEYYLDQLGGIQPLHTTVGRAIEDPPPGRLWVVMTDLSVSERKALRARLAAGYEVEIVRTFGDKVRVLLATS